MRSCLLVMVVVLVFAGWPAREAIGIAQAGQPRIATLIVTDDENQKGQRTAFTPDTAKVFVIVTVADTPRGTPVKCVWIATKAQGAPSNYKISESTIKVGGPLNQGTCWMSRPNNGWPIGEYRAEVYLAGRLTNSVQFRVEKGPVGTAGPTQPRVTNVVLTDDEHRKVQKTVFTPNTPNIYILFTLVNAPKTTSVKCVWFATKTQGVQPNYKIDEITMEMGGTLDQGTCSISRPDKGWPTGDYRVEIYSAGKVLHTAQFRVNGK